MYLMIMAVSATLQYTMNNVYSTLGQSYLCGGSETNISVTQCACCAKHPACDPTCDGMGGHASAFEASDAKRLFGTVDVILKDDCIKTIEARADLTTRRNFISSTMVNILGLNGSVEELADIDIHPVEIFGSNVTITTFVLLNISIGIDDKLLSDKVFEIFPDRKSDDEMSVAADLVLSLNFLSDGGALAINPAVFTV
jgi:hypothetical protein